MIRYDKAICSESFQIISHILLFRSEIEKSHDHLKIDSIEALVMKL